MMREALFGNRFSLVGFLLTVLIVNMVINLLVHRVAAQSTTSTNVSVSTAVPVPPCGTSPGLNFQIQSGQAIIWQCNADQSWSQIAPGLPLCFGPDNCGPILVPTSSNVTVFTGPNTTQCLANSVWIDKRESNKTYTIWLCDPSTKPASWRRYTQQP